jgi:hypothetical protein
MIDEQVLTLGCAEADELSGLYVLAALEPAEQAAVGRHLASCDRPHPAFGEAAAVAAHLHMLVEPEDAPPELKDRVMAAVAAEPRAASVTRRDDAALSAFIPAPARPARDAAATTTSDRQTTIDISAYRERRARPASRSWLLAAAAGLIVAVLGGWNLTLQSRVAETEARVATLREAISVSTSPGARTASVIGQADHAGAHGFAAFGPEGEGYLVMSGLPPAPDGQTYQAWLMVDGVPASAGLLDSGPDGLAVLAGIQPVDGAEAVALTIEPAGGRPAPSGTPIALGTLDS